MRHFPCKGKSKGYFAVVELAEHIKSWIGNRSHAEAAKDIGIPKKSLETWLYNIRKPSKLAMCELLRRMEAHPDDSGKTKAPG